MNQPKDDESVKEVKRLASIPLLYPPHPQLAYAPINVKLLGIGGGGGGGLGREDGQRQDI